MVIIASNVLALIIAKVDQYLNYQSVICAVATLSIVALSLAH